MRKINFLYLMAIIVIVMCTLFVPINVASADIIGSVDIGDTEIIDGVGDFSGPDGTRINRSLGNSIYYSDVVWSKSGSPYIIESDVYVYGSLTIEPGVEVRGVKVSTLFPINMVIGGGAKLYARGTPEERIKIRDLKAIQVTYGSEARFENTDLVNITENILFLKSSGYIGASTIRDGGTAVRIADSAVTIDGSKIENNKNGIRVVGGYYLVPKPTASSSRIHIKNSSIVGQWSNSLRNDSTEYIQAYNNWWGSVDGPSSTYLSKSIGYVVPSQNNILSPWLLAEPDLGMTPEVEVDDENKIECCSNVLFIPGLKATRLYRDEPSLYGMGTSTNRLWDPTSNNDVRALYMDDNGQAIDSSVYGGSPIGSVFGIDIYGSFMKYMNSLEKDGTINDWKPFGHDWRKPVASDLTAGSINADDVTSGDIIPVEQILSLASTSKTGKVTIISHSNGGLVMKKLVHSLDTIGKSEIIDKVVSVAVPYLGTPKAILGLLHGYDEGIAKGLILKESVARGLGINMPSVYSLLPTAEYFKKISTSAFGSTFAFGPTIAFASTTVAGINPNGRYESEINDYDKQMEFIVDDMGSRPVPAEDDTSRPIIGNRILASLASYVHGIIDPFVWPSHIASYSIVGFGKSTASGILYDQKQKCTGFIWNRKCELVPVYSMVKTQSGDGTVVSPSASVNGETIVSLDLSRTSGSKDLSEASHADILSASTTIAVVDNIIRSSDSDTVVENLRGVSGINIGEHQSQFLAENMSSFVISTHSPVQLHVYDSAGNHTGEIPAPDGLDDIYTAYEENIEGSSYERLGDSDSPETYVTIPDNGRKYSVEIVGTGTGEFTYMVEKKMGAEIIDSVVYAGLPVTPLMVATTTVSSSGTDNSVATYGPLSIDIDGDGKGDTVVAPGSDPDPQMFLDMLRKTLESLGVKNARVKNLLAQIERIRNGNFASEHVYESLIKRVGHIKLNGRNKITEEQKMQIVESIERYLSQ